MPNTFVKVIGHTYRLFRPKPIMAERGASPGSIGYATARTLASWGADVVVTCMSDSNLLQQALRDDLVVRFFN